MTSESFKSIIDRDLSISQAKELIDFISPLLKECINYSSNLIARCFLTSGERETVKLAPLFLSQHMLGLADAIEVLLSQCCVQVVYTILRSLFEANLSIIYMLNDYPRKSIDWMFCYYQENLKLFKKIAISRQVNEYDDFIKKLEQKLYEHQFDDVRDEYANLGGKKNWFSLYRGPKNIYELAESQNKEGMYDSLYKISSSFVHATEIPLLANIKINGVDKSTIRPLREWEGMQVNTIITLKLVCEIDEALLTRFRPQELPEYKKWYIENIRESILKLEKTL